MADLNGLEIPSEIWIASENLNSLVFEPFGNGYHEYKFSDLRQKAIIGKIEIFPAIYRIKQQQ